LLWPLVMLIVLPRLFLKMFAECGNAYSRTSGTELRLIHGTWSRVWKGYSVVRSGSAFDASKNKTHSELAKQ
jgi:hypothetical protein